MKPNLTGVNYQKQLDHYNSFLPDKIVLQGKLTMFETTLKITYTKYIFLISIN